MGQCDFCGKEIQLPFSCNYCGGTFCSDHRLPEEHQCPNLPKKTPWFVLGSASEPNPKQEQPMPEVEPEKPMPCQYEAEDVSGVSEEEELPKKRKKHTKLLKVLLAFLAVVIVFAAIFAFSRFPILLFPSSTPSLSPSVTPYSSPLQSPPYSTSSPSPLPSQSPITNSHEELVNYVLSLINADRRTVLFVPRIGEGEVQYLQNVSLSSVNSAQQHAEDMLRYHYFSHWDTQGYKPYMRYTLAGGKGAVSENIAAQLGYYSDLKETLKKLEWSMMYDDAASNWGHKDNILDPLHNKVSIGIAYDSHNIYLVQDFENDYVSWSTLSTSNQIVMQGAISKASQSILQVAIYFDKPMSVTTQQLENPPYNGGYDPGTYVGMAVPPPPSGSQYSQPTKGILIAATTWSQTGQNFEIYFDLSPVFSNYGKGVYTLYLITGSSTASSLTTYSIWFGG
jgi:uncharacterized protein YkwD